MKWVRLPSAVPIINSEVKMIYVTGDTHIPIDVLKLNTRNFSEQKDLTKDDYLIICGDFGAVWNNEPEELYWRNWLEKKNFTTLFVDGNHENHNLLAQFPVKTWNGGKVHFIKPSVIHLMRGQVFNIDGDKFFTMGGATSIDKNRRVVGKSWWEEEIPSDAEYKEAMKNLDAHNWNVDYVISHTTSQNKMETMGYIKESSSLNKFFNKLEDELNYRHWFFGHFHDEIDIDKKHTLVYERIIKIK